MTENFAIKKKNSKILDEIPDSIHGRLLEAVHITGYTFERACTELEWLLKDGRWKTVGQRFEDIDNFLKTINFSSFKIAVDQRKKLVKQLEDLRATQRATAKMLGVTQPTVHRDLESDTNVSKPEKECLILQEKSEEIDTNVSKPPLVITQSGEDAARLAEKITKKKEAAEQRKEEIEIPLPPAGEFAVIMLDPPWPYGTEYDPDTRRIASPYPEMSIEDLEKLEIPGADISVMWLWTTHKFLLDAFFLMKLWGYEYKITLCWNKQKMGMGAWLRCQVEFCMLGIRGKPTWNLTNQTDFISESRRQHSRKPNRIYEIAEELFPGPKDDTFYLDFFSREKREGWAQAGNELTKF